MKYYSEKLTSVFDTEEELIAAEAVAVAKENEVKKLVEQCLEQFDLGAKNITESIGLMEKILDNDYASCEEIEKLAIHMCKSLATLMSNFI